MNSDRVNKMVEGNPGFHDIERWFHNTPRPYGLQEISVFNSMYGRVYHSLPSDQKRFIETKVVEELIDGVESPKLKSRIFGVC